MLFDTHESKRLFLQAITTCCLVRSCQTLKHRIKAPKQNRHRNDRRVRKDARYLQQNQTEVFSVSTKICNNTQRKKNKRKKERPDCCSSGPLYCKNDTDTPFNTPIFFVCILAKSNASSKTTLSKTGDPAL